MPDLTGAAACPVMELPIDDNPQPNPAPKGDNEKIIDAAPGAEPFLGKCQSINIVIQIDRSIDPVLDQFAQRDVDPPEERRLPDQALHRIDDIGQTDSNSHQVGCRILRLVQQLPDQLAQCL